MKKVIVIKIMSVAFIILAVFNGCKKSETSLVETLNNTSIVENLQDSVSPSELMNLKATAAGIPTLLFPLEGGSSQYTNTGYYSFGSTWTIETCGGVYKKHVGKDYVKVGSSIVGSYVLASYPGTIIKTGNAGAGWASYIVIQHVYNGTTFYTNYTHVNPLLSGWVEAGQRIATVADINIDHLHYGICKSLTYAQRGALPVSSCGGDPAFPGDFVNPNDVSFTSTMSPTYISPANNYTVVGNSIMLKWNNPSGTTSARIHVFKILSSWNATDGSNNTVINYALPSNNLISYTFMPTLNTTYYWSVRAYNPSTGTSLWTTPRYFKRGNI